MKFQISSFYKISCEQRVIQATLLNRDMCNPDFRLNRTDWKVPYIHIHIIYYAYNSYKYNLDFA